MRPIYLSIDLDYWCQDDSPSDCRAFFEQVFALKKPIMVVMTHHHLLLDIEASDCLELWNVDWHSDLCEENPPPPLNEGTWGAHISWRSSGTFVWRYPRDACLKSGSGYCHDNANPFIDRAATRWGKTILRKGTKSIPWHRVTRIGLALSPHWVGDIKIIDFPLRKLRVVTLMKDALTLCANGMSDPLYDIRYFPPRVVDVT